MSGWKIFGQVNPTRPKGGRGNRAAAAARAHVRAQGPMEFPILLCALRAANALGAPFGDGDGCGGVGSPHAPAPALMTGTT